MNNRSKEFSYAEMEIIKLAQEDILTSSPNMNDSSSDGIDMPIDPF